MARRKIPRNLIPLLRSSIDIFVTNSVVFIPFLTIAFIQLIVLEVLYFSPRYPLSLFFNPVVATLWGEEFIHYPNNFSILPKLFQNTQVFLYILVNSYFIAVAMSIISAINNNEKINFSSACRDTLKQYVHIFFAALLAFCTFLLFYKSYNVLISKVLKFSSVDGVFFTVKKIIVHGAPYANLLMGAFVTAVFAFVFPVIVIEKKKFFAAIWKNFKYLWGNFWFIFFVVLLPTLLYVPVILLRYNIGALELVTFPEVRALVLMFSIIVTMFIDAVIYTAITSFYLLKKEYK